MQNRGSMGAIAVAAALSMTAVVGQAHDVGRYPDLTAQWNRTDSAQFDPSKPAGNAQKAPLTPEYQAMFDATLKDRAAGGLADNYTASCLPAGMPRAMIGYEPIDFVVTPEITFVRLAYMRELRRIFTDGRDWPKTIEPSFIGTSIGKWIDQDADGHFDTLEVETRGFKGPRTYDGAGLPFHSDNQTVVKERIYLDKTDVLHDDITVFDHALTRPWAVMRKYKREAVPYFAEYVCAEGNEQIMVGKENYMVSADGYLMPVRKDQPPPDLRHFEKTPK